MVCLTRSNLLRNDHFTPKRPRLTSLFRGDWLNFLPVYFWMQKCPWERIDSSFFSRRVWLSDDVEYKSCSSNASVDEFSMVSLGFFGYFYYTARRLATTRPAWAPKLSSEPFMLGWPLDHMRVAPWPVAACSATGLQRCLSGIRKYCLADPLADYLTNPLRFKVTLLSWLCWNKIRMDGCC